jgi:hypothetical protein
VFTGLFLRLLLTTLVAGLVLPALLLATLAGFVLAALLTTLVLLAVLVWIAHRLFLPVDFRSEDQPAGEAFVPGCHLTQACALWVTSGQAVRLAQSALPLKGTFTFSLRLMRPLISSERWDGA